MKIEEAIRLLHPDTSADEIAKIKYKYGFRGEEHAIHKVERACKIACKAMEKQKSMKVIIDETSSDICPACGDFVSKNMRYCISCGQKIEF